METPHARIECKDCGRPLNEGERSCHTCGSDKRTYRMLVGEGKITPLGGLGLKHKVSTGFCKVIEKIKSKISGKTKRLTREVLTIDRTDHKVTRKTHHVEEVNEEGQAKVVHHEEEEFPAKRRPGKAD